MDHSGPKHREDITESNGNLGLSVVHAETRGGIKLLVGTLSSNLISSSYISNVCLNIFAK